MSPRLAGDILIREGKVRFILCRTPLTVTEGQEEGLISEEKLMSLFSRCFEMAVQYSRR